MSRTLVTMVAMLLAIPSLVRADAAGCTAAIGRESGKLLAARWKAISRCENARASGRLPATTVCRPQCDASAADPGKPCASNAECPGGTCLAVTHAATGTVLANAAARVAARLAAACAGVSPLPPIGPACDGSAATPATLAACIGGPVQETDTAPLNADALAFTVYGNVATPPTGNTPLWRCQAAIGKALGKYVQTRYTAVRRCNERLATGVIDGPCPDLATVAAVERGRARLDRRIRRKCTETQVAATAPPKLAFGPPCEQFLYVTYRRDTTPPPPDTNAIPALDRLIRCLTDPAAGAADRIVAIAYPGFETSAFTEGVAAGDATDTTAIFWTRFPDPGSGGLLDISTDPTFATGVQTVSVPAPTPGDDGTVKVEVSLLAPFTEYFYRFRQGSDTSPTGRVKTAPAPAATQAFRVGWSGDANAYFRPFTVLDPVRLQNLDAWFFIGDTIYGDDPRSGTGIAVAVADYYGKYKENRADRALRQLMQSTGTYVMWDDHESRNDVSGTVPAFATKVANGNYAFRKYNPLREDTGDPTRLYRSFKFGTLAEFFLIDIRSYRSAKYTCCNNPAESGYVLVDDDTTCTTSGNLTLPDPPCTAALQTPGRTVLGATQLAWLKNALLTSTATFKFIMNGPPITNLVFQPYDFWIGYPAERDEILGFILDPNGDTDPSDRIPNVIWLSTDLHGIVISGERVSIGPSQPIPEVVGGAIGMEPIFRLLPASIGTLLPTLPGVLTQITQFDIDRFNAAVLTVTATPAPRATIEFYDRSNSVIQSVSFP